jgi:expansin
VSSHRHPSRLRLPRARWLATAGAAVLAGIVGVTLVVQQSGGACAAPPSSAKKEGKATFYDLAGEQGNCSFDPPEDDLYVALGVSQYSDALSCGSYIDVTGPKGKVRVKVFDKCPECTVGWLDLSRTAFKKIADESTGVVPITYKAVPNAAVPGPMTIEFKEGSSQYWWAIQVDNHANPIKSVEAKGPGGDWMTAAREDYNFWIIDRRTGNGPFTVKMTDIYGNQATATGVKLQPEKKQTLSVRFAGSSVVTGTAPKPAAKKKTSSPSPSPSASASAPASAKPSATASSVAPASPSAVATEQDLALTSGSAATC